MKLDTGSKDALQGRQRSASGHPAASPLYRALVRPLTFWILFIASLATYWVMLNQAHQSQLQQAEQQVRKGAEQTVAALTRQTETMMHKIDYIAQQMGDIWVEYTKPNKAESARSAKQRLLLANQELNRAITLAQKVLPEGAVVQVAIADAQGTITFSNLEQPSAAASAKPVSIADREHFLAHLYSTPESAALFVSHPVFGRISHLWTVQFTRPLFQGETFAGVVVLSVSVKHLSEALHKIFPEPEDVALIVRDDGSYLARSEKLDAILGTAVQESRAFMPRRPLAKGSYNAAAAFDGITRFYTWQRAEGYPVVVSVGLSTEKALAPVHQALDDSHKQNLIGTILLLLAATWITRLWLLSRRRSTLLQATQERMAAMLDRAPGGVLMEDEQGNVVVVNLNFCTLMMLEESPGQLLGLPHRQLCELLGSTRTVWLHDPAPVAGNEKRQTIEVIRPDGRVLEISWVGMVRGRQPLGRAWMIQDISERKQHELYLAELATTDSLTMLSNRRSFMDQINQALHYQHNHPGRAGVVMMADLDHFKQINDHYGHAVGDKVLQHVAQLLRANLRQQDSAGRLGGEEFAILLQNIDMAEALQLAERIRVALEQTPTHTRAGPISVTISIGLAALHGSNANTCLHRADEALYNAKGQGRNRVCVWSLGESAEPNAPPAPL